jgi:hypothetical protein
MIRHRKSLWPQCPSRILRRLFGCLQFSFCSVQPGGRLPRLRTMTFLFS